MRGHSNGAREPQDSPDRPRRGDRAFIEGLIERWRGTIRRRVGRGMGPSLRRVVAPEDVEQDVIHTVFRKAAKAHFPNERAFGAWLGVVMRNLLADLSRRLKTRRKIALALSLDDDGGGSEESPVIREFLESPDSGPYAALRMKERVEEVRRALKRLSPAHRMVIDLAMFRGMSFEEIARRTRTSRAAVQKSFRRALLSLRRALGPATFSSLFRSTR